MSRPAEERREALVSLYREASACTLCALSETRTRVVFGNGNADADLMFVGEGPGANEDQQGIPFVGRAGKLLDEMLGESGMTREDVFVANTVKCRPPGNRDPEQIEIDTCWPYLRTQVELIEPRVICTLGNFATKKLTGSPQGITKVHGEPQAHEFAGRAVWMYPLFHPAAALRTPKVKEQLSEDFARLPELLARELPDVGGATREATPAEVVEPAPRQGSDVDQDRADQLGLFG